jgi:dihydroxy-acid dehydratase
LADLKPSGKYVMEDVQNIGGTPGLIKFLIDNGMFGGNQMTVTGMTHTENLQAMNHPNHSSLVGSHQENRTLANHVRKLVPGRWSCQDYWKGRRDLYGT